MKDDMLQFLHKHGSVLLSDTENCIIKGGGGGRGGGFQCITDLEVLQNPPLPHVLPGN